MQNEQVLFMSKTYYNITSVALMLKKIATYVKRHRVKI